MKKRVREQIQGGDDGKSLDFEDCDPDTVQSILQEGNLDPVQAAKEIADIDRQRAELRKEMKELQKKRRQIEKRIVEYFEQSGLQNLKIDGRTVYLHRRITAKPKDGDYWSVAKAFIENGWEDMVRVNAQTLASLAREAEQDPDRELPKNVRDCLEIDEVYSIRSRKA